LGEDRMIFGWQKITSGNSLTTGLSIMNLAPISNQDEACISFTVSGPHEAKRNGVKSFLSWTG